MTAQPNKKALYTVHMEGSDIESLALHVIEREGRLCFDDTNRGHMFDGTITKRTEDGFIFFNTKFSEEWQFKEVTLERFKSSVYKTVGNGANIAAVMSDTADLWEWYRKEFPADSSM